MRSLLSFYFIIFGCVGVLAITSVLPLPLLLALFILLCVWLRNSQERVLQVELSLLSLVHVLFYCLIVIIISSYLLQTLELGFSEKGLHHLLSYLIVIPAFYFAIYFGLHASKISMDLVFKYIAYGVMWTATFAIIEFVSKNYLHMGDVVDELTLRAAYEPIYNISGHSFIRARSVAEESGHYAMYLVMFSPFALYYFYQAKSRFKTFICFFVMSLALATTFSASAFLSVSISLVATTVLYLFQTKKNKVLKIILTALIGIMCITLFFFISDSLHSFDAVFSKLTFEDTRSAQDRLRRWLFAFDLFQQKPFIGGGPGISAILTDSGIVNLYLELLTQFGGLGFIVWIGLLFVFLKLIMRIKGAMRYVYFFSMSAALIHYAAISNYWFPWLWNLFALISYHSHIQFQYNLQTKNGEVSLDEH
ncbi:O-antigen ligase family protein [Brevibacillus daliensis]|uniref:O-antigen ligase family protein n=1 Tax=Brevibacillus daliensis TaxID=2892995 RepID=UPI001E2B7323|nr:O-antigen ligase family protein [Brevibacillus daliensis]